jgi:brefeldin A-inhibited guanine nucleotide-exchange protein
VNEDLPELYTKKKIRKDNIERIIKVFNRKPKYGVELALQSNLLEATEKSVAHWLHTEARLSKIAIGEYLGEHDEFSLNVMHNYIDQLNFQNMGFVDALRFLLKHFRLPGEGQKIDRIVEKFAGRFVTCNPNHEYFSNADTAYVMAYSTIMLTTDLHSPRIKNKMSKESFIKNNAGINEGKDLPAHFLSEIFDNIQAEEIRVSDNMPELFSGDYHALTERQKKAMFLKQSAFIALIAEDLLSSTKITTAFVPANSYSHVKCMFAVAFAPCLATFSLHLERTFSEKTMKTCLRGFQDAIIISSFSGLQIERDSFVKALATFTSLSNGYSLPSTLTRKNVLIIALNILVVPSY